MVGQLVMLAQEGDGAEDSNNRCGDCHANQVIGAGGGIGLLGRFLLFGRTDDDDGAGVIGGGRDDLAGTGLGDGCVLLILANRTCSMLGTICGIGCRGIGDPVAKGMSYFTRMGSAQFTLVPVGIPIGKPIICVFMVAGCTGDIKV